MTDKTDKITSRCVVLVPVEHVDVAHNITTKYQLHATIEHDPAIAMAELCLLNQQLRTSQVWMLETTLPRLILIHASEIHLIDQMVASVRRYFPNTLISELRDGRLEQFSDTNSVLDSLVDSPTIDSATVDPNELSMLLDDQEPEDD